MIRRLLLKWVWCILLCHSTLYAQTTVDLYQAEITVKDHSEIARNEGFKHGLTQVLIKLSGDRKAPLQPAIQQQLTRPDRLVMEYSYLTDTDEPQSVLSIYFDQELTDELLARLKLPKWSSTRPVLLGWILLDTQDQQTVLTEETSSSEIDLLKQQAQQRGIPLLLPLLDLEDLATFKVNDVITGESAPALSIAERYGVKTLLVGWLLKTSSGWQAQWNLYINQKVTTFNFYHPQLSPVLEEGINRAVDEIAQYFRKTLPVASTGYSASPAVSAKPIPKMPGSATSEVETKDPVNSEEVKATTVTAPSNSTQPVEFELSVTNVPTLGDYAKVSDYLENLDVIEELQVLRIQPGEVKFRVTVTGGPAALLQAVNLGTILVPSTDKSDRQETVYRFLRH